MAGGGVRPLCCPCAYQRAMPRQISDTAGHRLEGKRVHRRPIRRSPRCRVRSSLSDERDLIGSRGWRQVWQSAIVNRAKSPDRRHLRAAAHPTRRDGAIAIALFVLPWVVALVLVRRHHHLDGGTVGILVAASLGLPTLWVTWAAYRGPRRGAPASSLTMAQVADQLAVAVDAQWEAEARVRRLNDPYPLPVSWDPADVSLTDSWDSLVRLASSGAGWPASPPAGTWAADPGGLAGKGGELAEVLVRVPTGRLAVLGEPGAGKTMLLVRLVLDLLADRVTGGPVPFLVSIASWNPAEQDLRGWLEAQLLTDYPALAEPPADRTEPTRAAALLASGLILPFLDGLDEMPEKVRGSAIDRINDGLRPGQQVIVTCRAKEYRAAVRPKEGLEVNLRATAAVQLHPLDADAVCRYLLADAAGPAARARWDPVLAVLGTEAPVAQVLRTPLMVSLARAIYNPRPGELAEALRDPAELCSRAIVDRAAVESILFDAFIPSAYRNESAGRWNIKDAERWLVYLARHLECTIGGPDFSWWQLWRALPGFVSTTGITIGAVIGTVGWAVGWVLAGTGSRGEFIGRTVVAELVALVGVLAGIAMAHRELPEPIRRIRWQRPSRDNIVIWLLVIVMFGAELGILYASQFLGGADRKTGILPLFITTAIGLVMPLTLTLASHQKSALLDLRSALSPLTVLSGDRQTGMAFGAALGAGAAVLVTFLVVSAGNVLGVGIGYGIGAGVVIGAGCSFAIATWPRYVMARIRLALRDCLPWPLMDFLADAHRRGVLRQEGAVYQFRHIELQHRLANRDVDKQGLAR
jgi:hypothetical protein